MNIFHKDSQSKSYWAYKSTESNSSFPEYFDNTFNESGFLWSSQELSLISCVKAEVYCTLSVYSFLEIGSIESAMIIAQAFAENKDVEYYLASPLTCGLDRYHPEFNSEPEPYEVMPLGSPVGNLKLDKQKTKKKLVREYIWMLLSLILQLFIAASLLLTKYQRRLRPIAVPWRN